MSETECEKFNIRQISVFMQNEVGKLREIVSTISGAGANIRATSLADTEGYGIVRFVVDLTDQALAALRKAGLTVREDAVIAVRLADRCGALAELLSVFERNNINIEYIYIFITEQDEEAILLFRVEGIGDVLSTLLAEKVKLLSRDDISQR